MEDFMLWIDKPECVHANATCDDCRDAALGAAIEAHLDRVVAERTGGRILEHDGEGWLWECQTCGVISSDYVPLFSNAVDFALAVSDEHACRSAVV